MLRSALDLRPIGEVVERFQKAGYPVTRMRYLLSGELVTPAEVGFSLVLGEDPWLLLRFPSRQAADQEAQARGHCIQAGKYLLWSDPPKMYGAWEAPQCADSGEPLFI